MKEIMKFGFILMAISAISAASLALTYTLCKPIIDADKLKETRASLSEILPQAQSFTEGKKTIEGAETSYYTGSSGKNAVGLIIEVSSKGYGGPIDMLVGVSVSGKVTGVKVLKQSETPGLGSRADDPKFLSQFIGKTWEKKIKAKVDIQAISGATITSQAVSDGVSEALRLAKVLLQKR